MYLYHIYTKYIIYSLNLKNKKLLMNMTRWSHIWCLTIFPFYKFGEIDLDIIRELIVNFVVVIKYCWEALFNHKTYRVTSMKITYNHGCKKTYNIGQKLLLCRLWSYVGYFQPRFNVCGRKLENTCGESSVSIFYYCHIFCLITLITFITI